MPPRPAASTAARRSRSASTGSAPSGTTPTSPRPARPGRPRSSCPRSTAPTRCTQLVAAMEAAGAPEHTKLWAMVETPVAILDVLAIARASERLTCLVIGHQRPRQGALRRARPRPRADPAQPAHRTARRPRRRHRDRRRGLQRRQGHRGLPGRVRPGPPDGLRRQDPDPPRAGRGRQRAFAPSEQAVEDARGLIAAFEAGKGSGVVTYNGKMVENLHVESARRTLQIHDAISALAG